MHACIALMSEVSSANAAQKCPLWTSAENSPIHQWSGQPVGELLVASACPELGNFTSVIIGASIQQSAMPAYYKIDKERRLVMTTCGGVFTFADALTHQENLLKDSDFDPSFSQLVDLTQVTKLDIEAEEMRRFAQRSVFSPDSRRALLANTDHVFGMGRMFEILRENFGERGIRVFRNLDDALEWVLAKNTAA